MFNAPRILLGLSIAMIVLIIVAVLSYETAWSGATAHPSIANMEIGGERATDDANNWLLGLAFGATTIASLVATLLFVSGPSQYARTRTLAILFGGVAYLTVFVVMMLRYRDYAVEGPSLLGPFSVPTTWMVFGLWSVPAIFVAIYCVKFDTWFSSDEVVQNAIQSEGEPN